MGDPTVIDGDYDAWKFWMDALQMCAIAAVTLWTWIDRRAMARTAAVDERIEAVKTDLSGAIKELRLAAENVDLRLKLKHERLARVEEQVKAAPQHSDLVRIHERIEDLSHKTAHIAGGVDQSADLLRLVLNKLTPGAPDRK
jgi:uncharacterized coiled-coil protein SlyX